MEVEIYLDSLFFLNFMINLWILQLLKQKFSIKVRRLRVCLAAILGAGVYILTFILPGNSLLLQALSVICSVSCMVGIMLPKRKHRYLVKMIGWGFFYAFVISGILRAVVNKWKLFAGREITIAAILAGGYLCMRLGIILMKRGKKEGKIICKTVIYSAGTETTIQALVDTGNSLLEPISRKPVCIMEEEILAQITLENPLFLRAIPYRSIGCEQGTLYGVEIPEIRIFCENTCYVAKNIICAGTPHKLSSKDVYQMILHPALLTEENKENLKEEQNVIGERNEKNDIYACGQGLV